MTTNFQLYHAAQNLENNKHFRGVYLKNQLKRQRPNPNESGIINLDNNKGTHWTAYYKQGNNVLYFDLFGSQSPKEELQFWLKYCIYFNQNGNSKIFYFTEQIQELIDTNCGELCLEFLKCVY